MKIKATITYTMKPSNPDLKYVKNPEDIFTFTDVYTFDGKDTEMIYNHIKNDLSCIANGGYDYGEKHINIIGFDFNEEDL